MGAWLGGKLFDPEVKGPPPLCLHLVTLAEIALRPLKVVMEPFVPGAYYQKNVFERFLQRALWSPVAEHNFLAVGVPAACPANGKTLILLGVLAWSAFYSLSFLGWLWKKKGSVRGAVGRVSGEPAGFCGHHPGAETRGFSTRRLRQSEQPRVSEFRNVSVPDLGMIPVRCFLGP